VMKFYKKNPEIKLDNFVVQGKLVTDETILCGKEFARFADPSTFPGRIPKLVEVDFSELTDGQRLEAKGIAEEQASRPPRHLGVITSDNMGRLPAGRIRIPSIPDVTPKQKAKASAPVEKQPGVKLADNPPIPATEDEIAEVFDNELPKLSAMYGQEDMADVFPGVTSRNAQIVLNSFLNLDELSSASNSELRKAGIRANFFDRLRRKASAERKAYEDGNK
jgi:hypothetical protein